MTENRTLMFYINTLHRGGAQRVMVQLAGRFAAAGWRSVLVTSFVGENEYPIPPGVERVSIEQEQLSQNALRRNLSRIRALRSLIRGYHPAALISFMAEPNFRALVAARGLPVKTIVSVRNDPSKEYGGRLSSIVGKYLLPLADGCVFQTHEAQTWFPESLLRKSTVIMNQVSEAFFEESPAAERRNIAAVGRLNAQKNHALLIRAYAALGPVDDKLVIYGEGELRRELEALVHVLGLEGRVLFPGLSDNIPRDLKRARLFVLSSDYEGMPNALLEAMALGLPCISADCPCGGPAEIIEDGINGLLFPVGDEQALADAMRRLLDSPEQCTVFGKNARKTAESFRPDLVFRQWENYVKFVIAGKENMP